MRRDFYEQVTRGRDKDEPSSVSARALLRRQRGISASPQLCHSRELGREREHPGRHDASRILTLGGRYRSASFPKPFTAEKDGDAWLCGCMATKNSPFCDGSHKGLSAAV